MGKRAPLGNQEYRDEPDPDAVSMHTTRKDYEYDDVPELPSYSDSEAAATPSSGQQPETTATREETHVEDPYQNRVRRYGGAHKSFGKTRNRNECSIRMEQALTDPDELQGYIENVIRVLPPTPLVRIIGTHQVTHYDASSKKNKTESVQDFDIIFNFQRHLTRDNGMWSASVLQNSDKTYRGSFRKTRAPGYKQDIEVGDAATQSLQDWCREYCAHKSWLKVFRVTRELEGFNSESVRGPIESFVRETHYHGHLDVTFPVEEKHVDFYSPHWINRARISWVRYLFYFTFLWLITWPILYFMTKWWAVYEVRWRWSRMERDERQGRAWRVYASQSEQQWVHEHRNLIKALVLEKFEGDASNLRLDVPPERVEGAMRGLQMPSSGNANVDAAVGFAQRGLGLWNQVQGRAGNSGGDSRGWGADS